MKCFSSYDSSKSHFKRDIIASSKINISFLLILHTKNDIKTWHTQFLNPSSNPYISGVMAEVFLAKWSVKKQFEKRCYCFFWSRYKMYWRTGLFPVAGSSSKKPILKNFTQFPKKNLQ